MTNKSTLVKIADTSLNYVSFEAPSSYVEIGGQRRLIFARRKSGECAVVANREDIDKFIDSLIEHGCADAIPAFKKGDSPSLQGAVDYQKSFVLGAFYLMLQDKLYESHYKSDCIKFNGTEICRLLGVKATNRLWAKKAFMTSALIIGAVWVELKEMTRALGCKKFIHIIQSVEEARGGFSVKVDPGLLPIWEKTPKIEHDISIYNVNFKYYPFAFRIGRKIEEVSDRKDWYSSVVVSAQTLFNVCTDLPETYTTPREYSKRISWLEDNLKHLVSVGLLNKWEWANGRPTEISEEHCKMINCVLQNERHNLTPELPGKRQNKTKKRQNKPRLTQDQND